jgi:hypothetical protein
VRYVADKSRVTLQNVRSFTNILTMSDVSGNASDEVKQFLVQFLANPKFNEKGFARQVSRLIKCEEVSINKNAEQPSKLEARLVCRTVVNEGEFLTFC